MTDRLTSLLRVQTVQREMKRLAEWRLSQANRSVSELAEVQSQLRAYIEGSDALGASLARTALRSLNVCQQRLTDAERARDEAQDKLNGLCRRDPAIDRLVANAAREAHRLQEASDLAEILDTHLSRSTLGEPS